MVLNIYRGRICSGRQYNHRWVRTTIVCLMDEMDEIRFRMRISKLEARFALREIEATALTPEIASP